jgi:hypothetical protein
MITLTDEEIWKLYKDDGPTILEIQKRIFDSALETALDGAPEEVVKRKTKIVDKTFSRYPLVHPDGRPDHIAFLPDKGGETYRIMVLRDVHSALGEKYQTFTDALETLFESYIDQIEPKHRAWAEADVREANEEGVKKRREVRRWRLNSLEKQLVREGMVQLEGNYEPRLKLRHRQISEAEKANVTAIVTSYYRNKEQRVSQNAIKAYLKAYREMKMYLQLVGPFTETLFGRCEGDIVFLDRDARPLHDAAKLYGKLTGETRTLHTAAVTMDMVPERYREAHHNTYGSGSSLELFFGRERPGYAWHESHKGSNDVVNHTSQTISTVRRSAMFRREAKKIHAYFSSIGALAGDEMTIVDMGFIGTATGFTQEALNMLASEKRVNQYLFFSGSTIDGFIPNDVPYMGLGQVEYTMCYEAFPKGMRSPRRLVEVDGTWAPEWEKLHPEETKWIRGIEGEVYLGVRLVQAAVHASVTQYVLGRKEAEKFIEAK